MPSSRDFYLLEQDPQLATLLQPLLVVTEYVVQKERGQVANFRQLDDLPCSEGIHLDITEFYNKIRCCHCCIMLQFSGKSGYLLGKFNQKKTALRRLLWLQDEKLVPGFNAFNELSRDTSKISSVNRSNSINDFP